MSFDALKHVFKHSRSKRSARLVLLTLANHLNTRHEHAFPKIETIMESTGLSRSGVRKAIKELEDLDEIKVKRGRPFVKDGKATRSVNIYELCV